MIEIWSKPACPYCVKAKQLCEREGYDFKYYMLEEDFTREELFELFPIISVGESFSYNSRIKSETSISSLG